MALTVEKVESPHTREATKLSYEDYHSLWKTVGTTRPSSDSRNPFEDLMNEGFRKVEYVDSMREEFDCEVYRQLSEHDSLMYGHFPDKKQAEMDEKVKANKIQLLKNLHSNKRGVKSIIFFFLHSSFLFLFFAFLFKTSKSQQISCKVNCFSYVLLKIQQK